MTNIDFDHPDYFKDINDVFDAFQEMAHNVKKVLLLGVMMNIYVKLKQMFQFITMDLKIRMTFMLKIFKLRIKVLLLMYVDGEFYDHFLSPQYGDHTVLNALAVIAISYLEKLDVTNIKRRLETFGGVKRRFNETTIANQVIVDDYAHHPREISATIETARKKYPHKEVVAVFQPHTF